MACRITGVSRHVDSYALKQPDKDRTLAASLVGASGKYPRFGYRRIAVMTGQSAGRVWRLWNRLGSGFTQTPAQEAPLWPKHAHSWRNPAKQRVDV